MTFQKGHKNFNTEESIKKISKKLKGRISPTKGIHFSKEEYPNYGMRNKRSNKKDKTFEEIYGVNNSKSIKKRISKTLTGYITSEEKKHKIRISILEYLKQNNNQYPKRIGKYEKQILDIIQEKIGFSIKRQFYINGYWLDGYCQELNLAIEVDEEGHNRKKVYKRDLKKQKVITKALNCNFIRIKVKKIIQNKELNKELLVKQLKEIIKWS